MKGLFRMRVHRSGREVLVAVSDADLVGRRFTDGQIQLDVSPAFYGEDETDAREVLRHLSACTIANLVGVGTVTLAVQHGFVDPTNILDIDGVPHAQFCSA